MSQRLITVRTPIGTLSGAEEGGLHVFRGIPYAEPPVGPLRFRPPQPVAAWSGLREATRNGPVAPQLASRLNQAMGDFEAEQDENCLNLNIWAPATADRPLPVMVWIHGGAFSSGSGSLEWYSGARFAGRYGMVVVTINYRLGPLGWLRVPGVSDGNMGLHDQIAALRWVKENIAAFGGDPDAVTVAGQSAGGLSIALLMASDAGRGLFSRAILQSAPLGIDPPPADEAEVTTGEFMAVLGLDANQTDALLKTPADKLLSAARTLGTAKKTFGRVVTPIGPIIDGALVSDAPMTAASEGKLAPADILIGTTREEMMAFFRFDPEFESATETQVLGYYESMFGHDARERLADARRRRPGANSAEIVSEAESWLKMEGPSVALAEAVAQNGNRAFLYRFDWQSLMPGLASCHCLELPFVFANPDAWKAAPMLEGAKPDAVAGLGTTMQSAWAAFVRSGSPDHDGMPEWPPYDLEARMTMCFDEVVGPVADPAGRGRRVREPGAWW